jgi:hypothetical protein
VLQPRCLAAALDDVPDDILFCPDSAPARRLAVTSALSYGYSHHCATHRPPVPPEQPLESSTLVDPPLPHEVTLVVLAGCPSGHSVGS